MAVPWYAAVTWVHGQGYLYRFFIGENFERALTARYNDPRPIWFYIPVLIGGMLPWSPFSLLAVRKSTASVTGRARAKEFLRLVSWAWCRCSSFGVGRQATALHPAVPRPSGGDSGSGYLEPRPRNARWTP